MNGMVRTTHTTVRRPHRALLVGATGLLLLGQVLLPSPARADGEVTCWPGPDGIQVCITIPGSGGKPGGGQAPPGGGNPPSNTGGQPPSGGGNGLPPSGGTASPPAGSGGPGFGQGPPQGGCAVAVVMGQPCAPPAPPAAGNPAPAAPQPIAVDLVTEATRLCAAITLPRAWVRMNPTLGLVNLPSWFWLDGYAGQPLTASETTAPPYQVVTIEVRAFPARLTWNYGDGSKPVSYGDGARQLDLIWFGQAYPAESPVAHTYTFSSLNFPDGFPITLRVEWATEYRVNGGPYQRLNVVLTRDYLGKQRVQELQPLITNP